MNQNIFRRTIFREDSGNGNGYLFWREDCQQIRTIQCPIFSQISDQRNVFTHSILGHFSRNCTTCVSVTVPDGVINLIRKTVSSCGEGGITVAPQWIGGGSIVALSSGDRGERGDIRAPVTFLCFTLFTPQTPALNTNLFTSALNTRLFVP